MTKAEAIMKLAITDSNGEHHEAEVKTETTARFRSIINMIRNEGIETDKVGWLNPVQIVSITEYDR